MRVWTAVNHLIENDLTTIDEISRSWQMPVNVILEKMENNEDLARRFKHNLVLRFRVNPLFLFYGEKPIVIPKEEAGDE